MIKPEGGIDWALFRAFSEEPARGGLSLDDLYDLVEIDRVGQSHRDAVQANIEAKRKATDP